MKLFKHLFTAAMLAFAVTACDEGTGDTSTQPVTGTVSGAVTVEGAGQGGVEVSLSGTSSGGATTPIANVTTTDGAGNYSFPSVPAGTYVVAISVPAGTTFGQTAQAVTITAAAPGATASFAGEFIRTSAISGTVSASQGPLEGVQVVLSGDESRSTSTSSSGGYSFTGLAAGSYTVTITPPQGVDFDVTSASVVLGTGDAEVVSFTGNLPSTAQVAIKSITTGIFNTPVNPTNVAGQIDVTLTVEPGNDLVETVALFVDEVEVGRQDFGASTASDDEAADEAGQFDVIFPILTAAFDGADGTPEWLNGDHEITAAISTLSGGAGSAATSQTLTFNNADALIGTIDAENGPVISTFAGRPFTGGNHTITVLGVSYSGGNIGSVTVNWPGIGPMTSTASPFMYAYQNSTTPAINIANYQTDLATGTVVDVITVTAASYDDGTPVLGAAGTVIPGPVDPAGVLVDNLAPVPGMLVLPEQSLAFECCFNSYSNGGYGFAAGHAATGGGLAPTDGTGVGGLATTYHPGASSLTTANLVLEAAADDNSGLAESATNAAYSVAASVADALGNTATARLAVNGSNAALNANGATYGIDNTAPTVVYAAGSPADMSINPGGPNYNGTATDAGAVASGFGPTAWRSRGYGNFSDATTGVGSGTNCFYGTNTSSVCTEWLSPAGGDPIPTISPTDDAYWTDERFVVDAAGNRSTTLTATHLFDLVVPTVSNVAIPPTIAAGAPTTYTADAADNVDLAFNQPSFSFVAGLYWQAGAGQVFGPGFTNPPVTAASISETVTQLVALEPSAGNLPSGALNAAIDIRFVVNDVAGNQSTQVNAFAAGTVPAGTSFTAIPVPSTGQSLTAPAAATALCDGLGPAGGCGATPVFTTTVTLTSTGPSGTYAFPCSGGTLLYETNAAGNFDLIGSFPAPSVTDGGGVRTWTTSTTFDATGHAVGPVQLWGACLGTGPQAGVLWPTQSNNNITVVSGS